MENKLRVIELFGGIGSCTGALKELGIDLDVVDYVEIDKFATQSYNAINGTNFEPQDILKWDEDLKDIDLIMHGSPCTSISIAGLQKGADKESGTTSSLMWETVRIIEKIKPKYVIWENVKNLLSFKHRHNFDEYITTMEDLGYSNYYKVLNSKNFIVAQNRERVFTISIRNDIQQNFEFPIGFDSGLRLKDFLEDNVDEKYYLSQEKVDKLLLQIKDKNSILLDMCQAKREGKPREYTEYSPTLTARDYKEPRLICEQRSDEGLRFFKDNLCGILRTIDSCGDKRVIEPKIVAQRGRYDQDGKIEQQLEIQSGDYSNTLTTVQKDNMVLQNLRIRKLTPLECWRLQGFRDEMFYKAKNSGVSDSQLYKQAGNSITMTVLVEILRKLLIKE